MPDPLAFIDLAAQRRHLGRAVDEAILRVLEHGLYVMGPEVARLEADLAAFCGARHSISCANGTDALALILMAEGVKAGDAVFCPAFTFAATAEAVALVGATPVFVDICQDTFNLDPTTLRAAIAIAPERLGREEARRRGTPDRADRAPLVACAEALGRIAQKP